jgi:TolB-like protein
MENPVKPESGTDAVDRYLAEVAGNDEADADVFARCDAVMALAPNLADSRDVGWAYAEAKRLARAGPASLARPTSQRWYLNPALAWSTAGVLAVALAVASLPRALTELAIGESGIDDASVTGPPPLATSITFAPIVISPELAQMLAGIEPVVVLANEMPVDARSLAVLPFAQGQGEASSWTLSVAESVYAQVLRQLSAVPGIIVVDSATAAIYSESELPPEEIAHQLGVRSVVQGRVESVNGEIRFELRLTDAAAAGSSIDEAIERPTEEIGMLQVDIASSVLGALARTQAPIQSNQTLRGDSR